MLCKIELTWILKNSRNLKNRGSGKAYPQDINNFVPGHNPYSRKGNNWLNFG